MSQLHGTGIIISMKSLAATIPAFRILKPGTSGNTVAVWDTQTAIMLGVSAQQSQGGAGTSVAVAINGCANLTAGASVSMGAIITGTTTGLGIEDPNNGLAPTVTTLVVPFTIGIALDTADTNSTFELLIRHSNLRFDF